MKTTGDLRDYDVLALMRLLIGAGKSGILKVQHGNYAFRVSIKDGLCYSVELGPLRGAMALSVLLNDPRGTFTFQEVATPETTGGVTLDALAFEALGHLEPKPYPWMGLVTFPEPIRISQLPLSDDERRVIDNLHDRAVLEIDREKALPLLWRLHRLGLIKERRARVAQLNVVASHTVSSRANIDQLILQRWRETLDYPVHSVFVKDEQGEVFLIPVRGKAKINAQLLVPVNLLLQLGMRAGQRVLVQPFLGIGENDGKALGAQAKNHFRAEAEQSA